MGFNDGITSSSTPTHTLSPSAVDGRVDAGRVTPASSYTVTKGHGEGNYVEDTYKVVVTCTQHHATNQTGWPTLSYASGTDVTISHKDINALKFAVNSLQKNWSMAGGGENYFASKVTFDAKSGTKMALVQWQAVAEVINTLNTYMALPSNVSSIDTDTKISMTYHNEIITKYNKVTQQCLCNSDCSCNSQCVCNTDCGCHYSDRRLKKDITYLCTRKLDGKYVPIYEYLYKDEYSELNLESGKQVGVMAQDLIDRGLTDYVVKTVSGFYGVRYNLLKDLLDF